VKIALIQINPVIGDFTANCKKIADYSHVAAEKGCSLAIFPELAVSGYPPLDLLERQSFLNDHTMAVENLLENLPSIDVMFGCFEVREKGHGKPLYNSAVVARGGSIIFRARKRLLPAYDVFDENRYFEPGPVSDLYVLGDLRIGVTVCEDIWHHTVGEYQIDPVADIFEQADLSNQQVDVLINVSASPYHRGKAKIRSKLFSDLCTSFTTPFLYVNQVGGQDSLLFDGRSLALNNRGEIIARAHSFEEDVIIIDSEKWIGDVHGKEVEEIESIHDALIMGIKDYVYKTGFTSVVLGLSGGIDSAVTAALAVRALGAENVLGVALPSQYSSAESLEDARQLAEACGSRFSVLPIKNLFSQYKSALSELFTGLKEDVTEQNIQARIRGNLLMALSNKFGDLLLTTGNKSEMAVGYCTLYGDMSGGLAVISDVPKQLVYELAHFINRTDEIIPSRTITKPPSAELRPDQCDQDDLPPYDILDQILEYYLEEGLGIIEIVNKGFDETVVKDVVRRVRINEYKRKQAPMGLKVTSKAFGFGRRLPNVQNYQS